MRHRHAVSEAVRARLQCEAFYCAGAPLLCGDPGLPFYRGFLERMSAIIDPALAEAPDTDQVRTIEAVAARAKPNPAILNDPETVRRLADINRRLKAQQQNA